MDIQTYLHSSHYKRLLDLAFEEDLGDGDHSSLSAIAENHRSQGRIMVKQDGIMAGLALLPSIYNHRFESPELQIMAEDGQEVKAGQIVATVTGQTRTLLGCERIALNLMQQLSGTATATFQLCQILKGTSCRLLDTRKTIPGMRMLQKWAVHLGGGENHRIGLFDMIMLKDNHIDASGGIENALAHSHTYLKKMQKDLAVEVETRNLEEVKLALKHGANRIMFDNFTPERMAEAVAWVNGRVETEASGGITGETLRKYADTGVQFISTGWITHSAPSLDISLKIKAIE